MVLDRVQHTRPIGGGRTRPPRRIATGLALLAGATLAGPLSAQQPPTPGDTVAGAHASAAATSFPALAAALPAFAGAPRVVGPSDRVESPVSEDSGAAASADLRNERTDAWGVRRNPVLAVGEIFAINLVTWGLNHWGRSADFTRVYPRTWWNNISNGFEYDGNLFSTNVIDHPFHGSLYHNASRSNGLGFWTAAPLTAAGSFMWECCGETYPMALNDLVYTSLGGIAMGESTFRLSSAILDNQATGAERFGREAAAFVVNPIRGVNRLLSGHAGSVRPNPIDPDDRTPSPFALQVGAGYRAVGRTGSLSEASPGGVLELRVDYGSPFEGRRGGAFDVFELDMSLVTGDRNLLGSLAIRGNLLTRDVRRGTGSEHVLALVQGFEFDNTEAYQFGTQSLGARLESRWPLGGDADLRARIQGGWLVLGTLDSEFTFSGPAPEPSTLRSFDYGTGFDGRVAAEARAGGAIASLSWRVSWMGTVNGTQFNGAGASHLVQRGRVRGQVPLLRGLALGSELSVFMRDSDFELEEIAPVHVTVPELRLYGVWTPSAGRG